MNNLLKITSCCGILFLALLPIIVELCDDSLSFINSYVVATINALAWFSLFLLYLKQKKIELNLFKIAKKLSINPRSDSFENIILRIIKEIHRKNICLSNRFIDKKIISKDDLSRTLEKIVGFAFKILNAESVELTLFDAETNTYHTSYVMGKPFGTSTQAMLTGAANGESEELPPYIVLQEIKFAGTVLGTIRAGFSKDYIVTNNDQEILNIISFQSGVAILNASYTKELFRMKQFADESIKVKTGFLANLSHEIRGPLGVMLNAVELVLDGLCGNVTTDQAETLKMIKQNGEHLLDLINDVLDYAKIESGKLIPQPVNLDLNEI